MRELTDLGVKRGDMLIVHSSLKSLGYMEGGAQGVINSILEIIGPEGTLIVPTLTGKREDSSKCPPVFNVLETPCWTGIIPETVRKLKGAKRSLHPTHSVSAIGRETDYITCGHQFTRSPCDMGSPYFLNAINNGYILLIGVDQESNTSIHSCEELAQVPYHLQKEITEAYVTGYDGEKIKIENRLHCWEKPETDFNKLDNLYMETGIMRMKQIGNAQVRYIDAGKMFTFTIDLLKKNKQFLVKA
ncbi:MAG: family N-acetyltransferase [Eubacterium sp.]|nr:family N-acetyltransferase [Eubacterium sp.]